jgi:hypothetical protein
MRILSAGGRRMLSCGIRLSRAAPACAGKLVAGSRNEEAGRSPLLLRPAATDEVQGERRTAMTIDSPGNSSLGSNRKDARDLAVAIR